MTSSMLSSKVLLAAGLAALLALAPAVAEARAGGGSSFGSRGSRTFSAPPSTTTAPRTAAPMERSMTPQTAPSPGFNRPATAPGGGLFGGVGGFGRGLLGGLLGAGLFGLLFGHGMFGGMGGLMSIIGLLLQIALVVFLARLAFRWWMGRQQPAMAGMSPRDGSGGMPGGGAQGFGGFGGGAAQPAPSQPLSLRDQDFNAFEKLLGDVQSAYGEEDLERLRRIVTPEMASYFAEEIAENARRGVVNRISGARLLQGDLSEAWREPSSDYASVAMRFSLVDVTQDRATGKVVSGDPTRPVEATEVWTFERPVGAGPEAWKLSGIQQTA